MNTIIVPTDFSTTSAAALRYAQGIAEATGIDIEVVHIHDGTSHSLNNSIRKGSAEVSLQIHRRINELIASAIQQPCVVDGPEMTPEDLTVSSREIVGSPARELIALSKRKGTQLIIMGGVGTGNVSAVTPLFGSIAREVAERAACPVLLIPEDYAGAAPRKVALAFDNADTLQQLSIGFNHLRLALKPEIHLAHVQDVSDETAFCREVKLMMEFLESGFPGYPVEVNILKQSTTAVSLLEYVHKNDIDLLVLGNHRRSFLGRLFGTSRKTVVIDTALSPLLIMPLK
ncbi:universal stress protein [Neolewinella antarctica]|uniref:Nucleotide-binding universal stress UspA family protein n=1 Tax=Neolewinella antarctica TaxID=442734 RepID=A0ABX0X8P3_9BACT|nr:universal stress protein [Neolewinella antarctica]NJC25586.1 nucleotide-binding universal stress UspA family protein [Neolewinella antarctica]